MKCATLGVASLRVCSYGRNLRRIAFRQRGVGLQVAGVARLATTVDGKAILEIAGQPVFELNRVAVSIWTKLAAGLSLQEINGQIAKEFGVPEERVASD